MSTDTDTDAKARPRPPFVAFEHEAWLGNRLGLTGPLALFDGVTNHETRRERIRKAILERGPDTICGVRAGMQTTYRQAFEQLYGEPL